MTERTQVRGRAAALRIENLDTDQIMPKQFLRGIHKDGLADGLLHDLRFDEQGRPRPDFVLNRPEAVGVRVLVGGANFGCGSSREHAVWGLQQFGIEAVVAPSFGEIFYSNAMNNGLLALMLPAEAVARLMDGVEATPTQEIVVALDEGVLRAGEMVVPFTLSARHRRMLMEGLDVIGLTQTHAAAIQAFAQAQAARSPWLVDVAAKVRARVA